jgi:hypothetical protein
MKSGQCLMTEKLSNVQENYRSILFFFSNEAVLKFIQKFKIEPTDSTTYYSTYSFDYNSFIKIFVTSILNISKLSKAIQKKF